MASIMLGEVFCQNGQIGIKKSTASVVLPLTGVASYVKYIGCYVDTGDRDIPNTQFIQSISSMTIDMCAINCENNGGYSYFGMQVG